jgi:hypothetical protein
MSFPTISQEGVPSNFDYQEKLPQIPNSVSSYYVSVAPAGLTVVTGLYHHPTVDSPFKATANDFLNQQSILSNFQSGHNPDVFLDCEETIVSGRIVLDYSCTNWGASLRMKLIGSSSFFETMILKTNSILNETILNYNLLFNLLLNSTINADEKYESFSISQLARNDTFPVLIYRFL